MQFEAHAATDIGKVRDRNEDAFLADEELGLFVVCDGMGGHAAGEVASRRAAEFVSDYLREHERAIREAGQKPGGYFKVVELAELATVEASRQLHALANEHPEHAGMGTTLTLLMLIDNKGIMAHVGDSRLYLRRGSDLHQLSTDHSLANEMLQRGMLKPEQFGASPYHHVLTRSVGGSQAVEAEMMLFDVLPGDTFLLCSDGLSNHLDDAAELSKLMDRGDLKPLLDELVSIANSRGGKDNITAIVVRMADGAATVGEETETQLKTNALAGCSIFHGLPYSRLMRLAETARLRKVADGERLVSMGDPCEAMFLVADGRLSIIRDSATVQELSRYDFFGETALVGDRPAKAAAVATEPTMLVTVSGASFQRLMERFPKTGRQLGSRLLEHFARRLDEAESLV